VPATTNGRPAELPPPAGPLFTRNVPQQVTLSGYSHFELQLDAGFFLAQMPAAGGSR
jgi:hypothetical protein